jgi:hypothetical protein
VLTHGGGHWGFDVKVSMLPDLKLGVVVMTNCNYPQGYLGPDKEFTRMLYEKFVPILEKQSVSSQAAPSNANLHQYLGSYALPGGYAHANISFSNDTLYFTMMEKPQFTAAIVPVGVHHFGFTIDPGKHPMLNFSADDAGKIIGLESLTFRFKKE